MSGTARAPHRAAGGRKGAWPVLILGHDVFNERSGTVIAMALTSEAQRAVFPLTLELRAKGLTKRSWLKISQVRTLPVERIGRRIGRASTEDVLAIDGLLEIVGTQEPCRAWTPRAQRPVAARLAARGHRAGRPRTPPPTPRTARAVVHFRAYGRRPRNRPRRRLLFFDCFTSFRPRPFRRLRRPGCANGKD